MFHVKWLVAEDNLSPAEDAKGAEDGVKDLLTTSTGASGDRTQHHLGSSGQNGCNLNPAGPWRSGLTLGKGATGLEICSS